MRLFDKPVHALSDREIEEYFRKERPIGKTWGGHFMRDKLPKKMRKNSAIVINLDDSTGPGTHYVCLIRLPQGSYYYDDSFGVDCPVEVDKLTDGEKLFVQTEQDQLPHEITCGYECIATINGFIEAGLLTSDKTGGEILTEKPTSRPTLEQLWENPTVGYVSFREFYNRVKPLGFKRKDVEEFHKSRTENQLTKTFRRENVKKQKVISAQRPFGHLFIDLMDVSSVASTNKGTRYLLNMVDVATRYAWSKPIKTKNAEEVARAAREVFNEVDEFVKILNQKEKPEEIEDVRTGEITEVKTSFKPYVQSDMGNEFRGAFGKLVRERGYEHKMNDPSSTAAHTSQAIVERFNQTLRKRINRYIVNRPRRVYIDALAQLVKSYNLSFHETIEMTPFEKLAETMGVLSQMKKAPAGGTKNKLKVGDMVRVYLPQAVISGDKTKPQWSTELYEIKGKEKNKFVVKGPEKAIKFTPRMARELQLVHSVPTEKEAQVAVDIETERATGHKEKMGTRKTVRELGSDVGELPEVLGTKRVRKVPARFAV